MDCASYVGGPLSSTIQLPSSAAAAIPEIEDMLLYLLLPKKLLKFLGFELWDRMSPTCISVPVPRKNLHFWPVKPRLNPYENCSYPHELFERKTHVVSWFHLWCHDIFHLTSFETRWPCVFLVRKARVDIRTDVNAFFVRELREYS